MQFQQLLLIVLILTLGIIVFIYVWGLLVRRRMSKVEKPDWMGGLTPAAPGGSGERQASLIGERIEEMVRERLRDHPSLSGVSVDFGTSMDGALQIWVDDTKYNSVEAIPDAVIRAAIADAVDEFNC